MLDRDRLLAWLREQADAHAEVGFRGSKADLGFAAGLRSVAGHIEAGEFDVQENDLQENDDG